MYLYNSFEMLMFGEDELLLGVLGGRMYKGGGGCGLKRVVLGFWVRIVFIFIVVGI